MSLKESISNIAKQYEEQKDFLLTEEASKTALVLPFLQALGYNVFDPREVVPEFTADVGSKKGERVDYAIMRDSQEILLIECKASTIDLSNSHASQLFRYFTATNARFAVLTNGVEYRFFADLEKENKMDERPFFVFNILDCDDHALSNISRFSKENLNIMDILDTANHLKYLNLLKNYLKEQISNPDDEFVYFLTKKIYRGRARQNIVDIFQTLTKRALEQVIKGELQGRINIALNGSIDNAVSSDDSEKISLKKSSDDNGIITTEEETLGYRIVQAITSEVTSPDLVYMRDAKNYCAILFSDNNRKPITRLHFNSKSKKISLFHEDKQEIVPLQNLNDIYIYKDQLKETVLRYLNLDN